MQIINFRVHAALARSGHWQCPSTVQNVFQAERRSSIHLVQHWMNVRVLAVKKTNNKINVNQIWCLMFAGIWKKYQFVARYYKKKRKLISNRLHKKHKTNKSISNWPHFKKWWIKKSFLPSPSVKTNSMRLQWYFLFRQWRPLLYSIMTVAPSQPL